jgi:hypothetical protein
MVIMMDAARRRLENFHNELAWHAWNSEALHRQKRLQPMKSLMVKHRSSRPQSWQEQMKICEQIAVAHGGRA